MSKVNCWEFKQCGREPGGTHSKDIGVCPAAVEEGLNGVHGGKNAGRSCWVVAGTLCGGAIQGTFAKKLLNCLDCDFFRLVEKEEGQKFFFPKILINMLGKREGPFP